MNKMFAFGLKTVFILLTTLMILITSDINEIKWIDPFLRYTGKNIHR